MRFRICRYISNEEKKALTWDKWTVLETNEEHAHSCCTQHNSDTNHNILYSFYDNAYKNCKYWTYSCFSIHYQNLQWLLQVCGRNNESKVTPHLRQQKVEMEEHQKQKTKTLFYKSKKANIIPRNIIICTRNLNCSILTPLKPMTVWHWDQWSLNFILIFKTFLL